MERILLKKSTSMDSATMKESSGISPSHNRVLDRLSHSSFVMRNFGPRQASSELHLSELIQDMVQISRPPKTTLASHQAYQQRNGGIAEVSFLVRAFVPEGEIADNLSATLGGIEWEKSEDRTGSREW
jgi:hypothetical protein